MGGGREDQATQTDEDEADMEPPRRLQRPTHFQSGIPARINRRVNLVRLYLKEQAHICRFVFNITISVRFSFKIMFCV
jgi:hypothetical protein